MYEDRRIIRKEIFEFLFQMALLDATKRVARNNENEILAKDVVKTSVKNYAESVLNGDNVISFDDTVAAIEANANSVSFGMIQKLINMTMKYLYIRFYDDDVVSIRFSACDCPMDSYMRDFVYRSYYYLRNNGRRPNGEDAIFDINCSWSKLGDIDNPISNYVNFQKAIDEIIEMAYGRGIKIPNKIEFDYMYFEAAKRLRSGEITLEQMWG